MQFFVVFGIDCCFKQRYKDVFQHLPKTRQNIFRPKYVTEGEKINTFFNKLVLSFTFVLSVICAHSRASVPPGSRNFKVYVRADCLCALFPALLGTLLHPGSAEALTCSKNRDSMQGEMLPQSSDPFPCRHPLTGDKELPLVKDSVS